MELKDRFFGRGVPRLGEPPVANTRITDPPCFALIFPDVPSIDADGLTLALRDFHPDLATATAEILDLPPKLESAGGVSSPMLGLIGWGRHVVKVVGFDAPMPAPVIEACVHPAHYDPTIKEQVYQHKAHVLLFYAGYESDPLEQHVALAAAAAALTRFGALVVLNEVAHTSVPAVVLQPHEEDKGDTLSALRALPLPFLYAGFVKIELEGEPGVWMRTYGCHVFKYPDLALHAGGHERGTAVFNMFANMLVYLQRSGRSFGPGDTLNVGEGLYLRLRARTPDEMFLDSPGELLIAEPIPPAEANS